MKASTQYRDDWRSAIYDATGDYVKTQRAVELAELNGLFDPVDAMDAAQAPMDREQVAKIFAYIWHGDLGEWRGFLSKADDFLAYPVPSADREAGK